MSEGTPKYTPEQIAELEKSRTISDAELLKGGAEYVVDEKEEKRLEITKKQLEGKAPDRIEMEKFLNSILEKNIGINMKDRHDKYRGVLAEITWYNPITGRDVHDVGEFIRFNNEEIVLCHLVPDSATIDGEEFKIPWKYVTNMKRIIGYGGL